MYRRLPLFVAVINLLTGLQCFGQVSEGEARSAVTKSVSLLQTLALKWFDKQSCASCYHQTLPMMVFDLARRRGVQVDQRKLELIIAKSFNYLTDLDRAVQGSHVIDPVLSEGKPVAAIPLGLPQSASTGAYARL